LKEKNGGREVESGKREAKFNYHNDTTAGIRYFSAPGRVEIGGNHTDHQHGRVLAAAIDLEATAAVKENGTSIVRINDTNFGTEEIDLSSPGVHAEERGASAALVRGVAAWFMKNGYTIGGFDADVSSNIPFGAGLSSSAAFEVLAGNIFNALSGAGVTRKEIAQAGQFAENNYFGKPCGLMDQTASSYGGLNVIDFKDPLNPVVMPVEADLEGYSLCVVNTGGSHADLTPDYAAITGEMRSVAEFFGKQYLRELPADEFYSSIRNLRGLGDRAVLRAIHFFGENERVLKQAAALGRGDMLAFFDLVVESGRSSLSHLQNVYSPVHPQRQGLTLALALSEDILAGNGAWRVHGGGFAGTILAFLPDEKKEIYSLRMNSVFGEGCCHFLKVRKEGGGERTQGDGSIVLQTTQ